MRLIADSGSTKTDWCICSQDTIIQSINTEGINPFHQSPDIIKGIVGNMVSQLDGPYCIRNVEFYGAGCALPEKKEIVADILREALSCNDIRVSSDLEGAARAVCQGEPGIACILGTGSNSCQFDGQKIVANTPCLGYILGDEGSGAVLGRTLVSDCLKGQLPPHLSQKFLAEYQLNQSSLLEQVYRQPLANRFLASFTPFLSQYRDESAIHDLLVNQFCCFFRRNVLSYDTTLPVHFVGSIAYYFNREVTEAARSFGLVVGRTLRTPMEGLTKRII